MPGSGDVLSTSGNHESPSLRGIVRRAWVSIRRCFLSGGDGIRVFQSKDRYTEESSLVMAWLYRVP